MFPKTKVMQDSTNMTNKLYHIAKINDWR